MTKQTLKPIARQRDPMGYPVGQTTSRTIALALRDCGVTRADRTDKGLLPALNVFNAPASMDPKQTIKGRGHIAWTQGPKGSRSYHCAIVLDAIPLGAIVPNYWPKAVMVANGVQGDTVDGLSLMSTKDLRAFIKGRKS